MLHEYFGNKVAQRDGELVPVFRRSVNDGMDSVLVYYTQAQMREELAHVQVIKDRHPCHQERLDDLTKAMRFTQAAAGTDQADFVAQHCRDSWAPAFDVWEALNQGRKVQGKIAPARL